MLKKLSDFLSSHASLFVILTNIFARRDPDAAPR